MIKSLKLWNWLLNQREFLRSIFMSFHKKRSMFQTHYYKGNQKSLKSTHSYMVFCLIPPQKNGYFNCKCPWIFRDHPKNGQTLNPSIHRSCWVNPGKPSRGNPPDRTTLLGSLGKAEWPQPTSWGDNKKQKMPHLLEYPPGKDHISHLGKFGKSSTQNAIFGGICDRSLEGISIVDVYTYAP